MLQEGDIVDYCGQEATVVSASSSGAVSISFNYESGWEWWFGEGIDYIVEEYGDIDDLEAEIWSDEDISRMRLLVPINDKRTYEDCL